MDILLLFLYFRSSIAKLLGIFTQVPDYEIVSRLQKLVDAHHDFTLVSRRYDDPALRLAARSPTGPGPPSRLTRTPDRLHEYWLYIAFPGIHFM